MQLFFFYFDALLSQNCYYVIDTIDLESHCPSNCKLVEKLIDVIVMFGVDKQTGADLESKLIFVIILGVLLSEKFRSNDSYLKLPFLSFLYCILSFFTCPSLTLSAKIKFFQLLSPDDFLSLLVAGYSLKHLLWRCAGWGISSVTCFIFFPLFSIAFHNLTISIFCFCISAFS